MDNLDLNDIEVAAPSVVKAAARNFAAALADAPQFKAFEQAYKTLNQDAAAHQALSAYQEKARSLRALIMLNALNEPDRAELERLKNEYMSRPAVKAYAIAEAELAALCQQLAGMISQATGLNYAAACGASCCG